MQIYPNPMFASERSARVANSAVEAIFNQQQGDPLAFDPYKLQVVSSTNLDCEGNEVVYDFAAPPVENIHGHSEKVSVSAFIRS
jgi:hypothetical protein